MKVSIITVCRNAANTVVEAIKSVEAQTYADIEHIVVDGASTDNTVELVRSHGERVAKLISEPDGGIYDAMNKGLGLATGDVVAYLNADDVYAHDGVVESATVAMADPDIDACYADLVYVSQEDPKRVVRYWKSNSYVPGACLKGWMPAHPTFFIRTPLLRKHGGFDSTFRLQGDFDLMLRLFEVHRIRTVYCSQIWVRMRQGGATNRSLVNVWKGNLEAWHSCRHNGFAVGPSFVVRKIISRLPQFFRTKHVDIASTR
jgi:glycosyltransferase involved in cell wall biosynthesis